MLHKLIHPLGDHARLAAIRMGLEGASGRRDNVPPPFILRGAEKGERDAVETVVSNAFGMDTGWSDIQRMFVAVIVRNVHAGFASDPAGLYRYPARPSNHRRLGRELARRASRIISQPVLVFFTNIAGGDSGRFCSGPRSPLCVRRASRKPTESAVKNRPPAGSSIRDSAATGSRWTPDFEVAQRIAA